ncbi:unnamed protein product [Bursaphelenchus xylophilus]|nr:unnamed protein product [Bursaphelenchus xylophilus]CAG9124874.1 unnamed protein product [Bursaphelenchus xylophilus]
MRFVIAAFVLQCVCCTPCLKKFYWRESFVCVCNSTYCDDVEALGDVALERAVVYSTDMKQDRLTRTEVNFEEPTEKYVKVTVDLSKKRQKIIGFGGCINDNIIPASTQPLQDKLIDQYFGKNGIEYSASRVPIGANDASVEEWTYLDTPEDYELKTFTMEKDLKIPILQKIVKVNPKIKLFAAAWSVPAWMKETGKLADAGKIKGKLNGYFYVLYAKYLIKFIEEYRNRSLNFWGITVMNEPGDQARDWPGTFMNFVEQRDFVKHRLGPMMKHTWFTKDIKIIAYDWHRDRLYEAAKEIYQDKDTYIDGLGVHWYAPENWDKLDLTHNLRPDKFIWATEATIDDFGHEYGHWYNAEKYADDIIKNLRRHVAGWIEWSLWTNLHGGPSYMGNFVGSSVIVNSTSQEFYKQPQFYALGHFSKFLTADSIVLDSTFEGFMDPDPPLEGVAAETPEGNVALVVMNRHRKNAYNLGISDGRTDGKIIKIVMKPNTIKTIVWKKPKEWKSFQHQKCLCMQ